MMLCCEGPILITNTVPIQALCCLVVTNLQRPTCHLLDGKRCHTFFVFCHSSSPWCDSDGNIYYRASTCVDQKYQTCRNGCSGITCTSTSSALSSQPLSDLFSQYNNTQSPGDRATTSAFDLIDFFANPYQSTSTSIGTTTPIVLNQNIENGDNASVLSPGSGTTSVQLPPGTTVVLGGTQNQTFTSGDLHNSPLPYNGVQNSGALAILANMKAALINALHYLQPFGGRVGGSL